VASNEDGSRVRRHRRPQGETSQRRPEREGGRLVPAIIIAIAVIVIAGGGWYYYSRNTPAENALAELRALPLIGAVMADNPGAGARLRAAIEEELRKPSQDGTTRPLALIADLRRQYILPAVRDADDTSAIAAVATRAALADYLQRANPAACREFAAGGIQRPDRLDSEGQRLFRNVLQALEATYRSGRASGKPMPTASRAEILDMLRGAGFEKIDFDRLNAFATLSNDVACQVELKVDQVATKLAPDKRGIFARFVLSN
jgi:hypothetical protein